MTRQPSTASSDRSTGRGARAERVLLVAVPVVAMATVALGLRVGASRAVRAAIVVGAPRSRAGTGLAWQIATFDEDHGMRQAVSLPDVEVTLRSGPFTARWRGRTNDDGRAEALLALPDTGDDAISVEVTSGPTLLASGVAAAAPRLAPTPPPSPWARFARRTGSVALDVAVVGQRAASGFPASLWLRASDAQSRAPIAGAWIDLETDSSLSAVTTGARTDGQGWAHVVATPMGYAIAMTFRADAAGGRSGTWIGALFVSPGAAQMSLRDRYGPEEEPTFDVVVPSVRDIAYVEVDDIRGRAWAAALPLTGSDVTMPMPQATVHVPRLAPGLYWAVAAGDPAAAADLAPGTRVRPFLVAASDADALSFVPDRTECAPAGGAAEGTDASRTVARCLALAAASPVPRWTALDGFALRRAREKHARDHGIAIALGGILLAAALETVLLSRVARAAREGLRAAMGERDPDTDTGTRAGARARAKSFVLGLLVALLGFALLTAAIWRAS